ncbi:fibronectin-binding domain-containing protein [Thiospirochaeta perfilievii]|uniref:Fibronectin-binding domain-containing protein n=1 Tax=Thiospirochaeta perfilievii TaxID=252967 RepID=A0A5C1QEH9_9SPIO|nr:NFACT family protein [Thiospirochaeta perfilievii]QEN05470.1 fibronectin-binding domain-containing protein [Thiospirochaeta perfilievii]
MSLNYIEIQKIVSEIDLVGSYFQKIAPLDYDTFLFGFYKTNSPLEIVVSTGKYSRIHLSTIKQKKLGKPHNLVEFIKAYLIGGRVESLLQINNNRVIQILISKESIKYYIYIRLWGGHSNIIITDRESRILHLHKKSRKSKELPNEFFIPPTGSPKEKDYKLRNHNFPTYNSFIEDEYYTLIKNDIKIDEEKRLLQFREKREKELNNQLKRAVALEKKYQNPQRYKNIADLIVSNIYKIKKGDTRLVATDYRDGEEIEIKIDPSLEPSKNSDLYYKKYKKALSGLEVVQKQIVDIKKELIDINKQEPVKEEVISRKPLVKRPGLYYTSKKWEFLVGRNAKENEILLRKYVKGNDMWLHARDYPGGYVFIKSRRNITFPLEVILDAGILALFYSKAKNNGKGDIMYTQVKNLRKIKKGKPGEVIPSNDKNIFVKLDKERLETLKA